jgi:hypothetical protein
MPRFFGHSDGRLLPNRRAGSTRSDRVKPAPDQEESVEAVVGRFLTQ